MDDAARARTISRGACLVLGLVLWAVAASPLARPGMIAGHDTYEHALIGTATADALRAGVFPLPALPAVYGGMGCQCIQYHCPALYYTLALLMLTGWPVYAAMELLMALAMVAGMSGMWAWSGRTHGMWGGLLGAVALVYAPYYLADYYWRVALPELLALSLTPWTLDALERHVASGARRSGVAAALLIALSMMLHAPSALMSALLLGAFGGAAALASPDRRAGFLRLARVAALASSLGAVYWYPTLLDLPHLNVQLEGTFVDYRTHFQTLPHLLDDEWSHTTGRGSPLHMGRAQVALGLAALVALPLAARQQRAQGWAGAAALICLVISVFLTGQSSQPVWSALAPLRNVFFPWRWLGPAAVALAALAPVCTGALLRWLAPDADRERRAVAQALAHLPLILAVAAAGMRMVDARPERQPQPTLADVRRPRDLLWNHYLPRGALPPGDERPVAQVSHGDGRVLAATVVPGRLQARVQMAGAGTVALASYAYPEWRAFVDGAPAPLGRDPIEGGMLVAVPPGDHVVDARFAWPAVRFLCLATGALALGTFVMPRGARAERPLAAAWAAVALVTLGWGALDRHALDRHAPDGPELAAPPAEGGLATLTYAGPRWTGATSATTTPALSLHFQSALWSSYTGILRVEHAGPHRFRVRSDDGAYLFVDGACVVDCGRPHAAMLVAGDAHLTAGDHEVAVLYFNGADTGVLAATVQPLGAFPELIGAGTVRPAPVAWLPAAIAEACRRGP